MFEPLSIKKPISVQIPMAELSARLRVFAADSEAIGAALVYFSKLDEPLGMFGEVLLKQVAAARAAALFLEGVKGGEDANAQPAN